MRIVEPSFEIVRPQTREQGIFCLREIERFARVSHRAEDKQTEDSWERFIKAVVVDKGDWSVTEHIVATVIARVDRGVTHEWVRHRIGSYTQESSRFVNYEKKGVEFIKPCFIGDDAVAVDAAWNAHMYEAEQSYMEMLSAGQSPQIARSVLPNATAATLVVTYNLRSWRQFFIMRTTKETHPDFKRTTIPLLAAFKERIPLLYDDIEPNQKQSISLARPR
jgi:thymidylate synthase (FAD)